MPGDSSSGKLLPGALLKLLNSTPAGEVLTERRLRTHRQRAGLAIGDGRRVDFLRYGGWLLHQFRQRSCSQEKLLVDRTDGQRERYAAKKERERERNAAASRKGRDLPPPGPPADPKRRARAEGDFLFFLTAYFEHRFPLAFSPAHLKLIAEVQRIVTQGGQKAFALPRGTGKTTICECAVLWATLTGRRRFVALIGASRPHADEMLDAIKIELETNDTLAADFPEVCEPIRALEGIHNRAKGQTCGGEPTRIRWAGTMLVLPTIAGSKASAAIICVRGITGRIRGMKFQRPDGTSVRPDLVIPDDPQTDASARSPHQVGKRWRLITGAILGLAGPGEKIACLMPCTIIEPGDLAAEALDREKHPEWHGETVSMVIRWPKEEKLWEEYAELRRSDMRAGGDGSAATELYRKHRREMDAGSEVYWPERKHEDELSALQHAMNLRIDHPHTFDAEYQNAPQSHNAGEEEPLKVKVLAAKVTGLEKGTIPLAASLITSFIDVQQKALYYFVTAWAPDGTGTEIEYGTWPDQERSYFTLADIRKTIQKGFPQAKLEGALRQALDALADVLFPRVYVREDGAELKIEKLLADTGWMSEVVEQWARESQYRALIQPSKGWGITADKIPMTLHKRKPGDKVGLHWFISRLENKRAVRLLSYDTFFWKSLVYRGLKRPHGDKGAISFHGSRGTDHRMLAEHCTSETFNRTHGRGRDVDRWAIKPERGDNHLWDGLVGTAVAASVQGLDFVSAPGTAPTQRPRGRRRLDVRF